MTGNSLESPFPVPHEHSPWVQGTLGEQLAAALRAGWAPGPVVDDSLDRFDSSFLEHPCLCNVAMCSGSLEEWTQVHVEGTEGSWVPRLR